MCVHAVEVPTPPKWCKSTQKRLSRCSSVPLSIRGQKKIILSQTHSVNNCPATESNCNLAHCHQSQLADFPFYEPKQPEREPCRASLINVSRLIYTLRLVGNTVVGRNSARAPHLEVWCLSGVSQRSAPDSHG